MSRKATWVARRPSAAIRGSAIVEHVGDSEVFGDEESKNVDRGCGAE